MKRVEIEELRIQMSDPESWLGGECVVALCDEIARLREALDEYGQHGPRCATVTTRRPRGRGRGEAMSGDHAHDCAGCGWYWPCDLDGDDCHEDDLCRDCARADTQRVSIDHVTGPQHFRCPDCGPHVAADEDGCCATCGADCTREPCGGHVCGTELAAAHDEIARLREALESAASSLETLARAGGRGGPDMLTDLIDVRGYAWSRAQVARKALEETK